MKKVFVVIVSLITIVLIVCGIAFWQISGAGGGSLEQWIGKSLQAIANSYITPTLSFDHLDYQYPLTVKLKHLRVTAADPMHPGKSVDIIGTTSAVVTLAKIPRQGEPIVIESIELDEPMFQAVAESVGGHKFIGLSNFVRSGVISTSQPTSQTSGTKLSDVFKIHSIKLNDGKIVYDPRIAGTEAMVLDHIWTELLIATATDGSYDVKIGLNRKPLFSLDASSRVNLDTFALSNMAIRLKAKVGQGQDNFLPPQVQKILNDYAVQGDLSVTVTGELPLKNYKTGDMSVFATLNQGNITTGDYKIKVDAFRLESQLKDGKVIVPVFNIKALKGALAANAIVTLNRKLDSDLHLNMNDVVIDELFVTPGTAEKPKLAGHLKVDINAVVPLGEMVARLAPETMASTRFSTIAPELLEPMPEKWGSGQIHLDHARLVNVPVLEQLSRAIAKTASLLSRKRKSDATETADMTFDFMGDQIKISEFTYAGEIVAARGKGAIALDQRLDLTVNAGPIEKLKTLLGTQIGDIIRFVTPDLLTYKVTGTIDDPKIGIMLGGGTTQTVVTDIGEAAVGGVGKVGKAIGNGAKGLLEGIFGK